MYDKYEMAYKVVGADENMMTMNLEREGLNEKQISEVKMLVKVWMHPSLSKHFKTICVNAINTQLIGIKDIEHFALREWKLDKSLAGKFKKFEYFLKTIHMYVIQNARVSSM